MKSTSTKRPNSRSTTTQTLNPVSRARQAAQTWLLPSEAAAILRCSLETLRRKANSGLIERRFRTDSSYRPLYNAEDIARLAQGKSALEVASAYNAKLTRG